MAGTSASVWMNLGRNRTMNTMPANAADVVDYLRNLGSYLTRNSAR
jgi:hypothetical protein